MKMHSKFLLGFVILLVCYFLFIAQVNNKSQNQQVIVYVTHDQDYAQPILEMFERETGISVKAIYDTEATKTVGLVNRLIAEKNNPQADVFWNNEVVRTIQLKKEGVLDIYKPKNYEKLNSLYRDPEGYWTGFAARARVFIANTNSLSDEQMPNSLTDLINSEFAGQLTLADPRFGTTGSQVAALFALWGKTKAEEYFLTLKDNGLDIAQSNGQTRDKVVKGVKWIGFTDTDDANDALVNREPVKMIYPDQGKEQIGTLVIPNTAMLIKGAKHNLNAQKLIDYLISEKTETALAKSKSAQMPLLPGVDRPQNVPAVETIKPINVSWEKIYDSLKSTTEFFEEKILE